MKMSDDDKAIIIKQISERLDLFKDLGLEVNSSIVATQLADYFSILLELTLAQKIKSEGFSSRYILN